MFPGYRNWETIWETGQFTQKATGKNLHICSVPCLAGQGYSATCQPAITGQQTVF